MSSTAKAPRRYVCPDCGRYQRDGEAPGVFRAEASDGERPWARRCESCGGRVLDLSYPGGQQEFGEIKAADKTRRTWIASGIALAVASLLLAPIVYFVIFEVGLHLRAAKASVLGPAIVFIVVFGFTELQVERRLKPKVAQIDLKNDEFAQLRKIRRAEDKRR